MVLVFYCCGVPYRKQLSPVKWCGVSANAQASGGGHKPQDDGLVGADPVSAPTNPFRAKQGLAPLLAFGSAGEPYAKRRSPPTPKHPCHPEPTRLVPLGPSCRGIPIDAQHRYGVTGRGHAPQGPPFQSALERPALRRRVILRQAQDDGPDWRTAPTAPYAGSISKIVSTSTATSLGNACSPTADRACCPFSPNTA